MRRRLAGNALVVGLFSSVVGIGLLLQEATLAYRFGVSEALAAFQIAFLWISLLWNVLAGGTLLQVLIPAEVWARSHLGMEGARRQLAMLSGQMLVVMAATALVLALAVPSLYGLRFSGIDGRTAALAGTLFVAMVPTLVLQALSAIAQSRLNVEGRFGLPAVTPVLSPLGAVIATLAFGKEAGVYAPAAGIVAGQILQSLVLALALPPGQRISLRHRQENRETPAAHGFFASYGLVVGAAFLLAGISWVDQAAAAHLGPEAVAHLAYANRPVFLFAAFATVAVANVALAGFTEHAARSDYARLKAQLRRGIGWIMAISVVALPLWGAMTEPIVGLLYERGAFSPADTAAVGSLQRWSLAQIPFFLVATLAWRMLNALRANATVLAATAACFALNAALVVPLVKLGGVKGILAGTTGAFAIWALILVLALRRRLNSAT